MSDEYEPDSPILSEDTPLLSGSTATLTGGEALSGAPDASPEYNYVTGPDGQMYAVQKEPFVWKKFFIGLGVPLFLMVVPIILSMIAEGMDTWDHEAYEIEHVDLELVNGTAYAANFTLDSTENLEDCRVRDLNGYHYNYYYCDTEGNSVMRIYTETEVEVTLIRGNGTSYSADFSLDSNQFISHCDGEWEMEGWVYCDMEGKSTSHFHIWFEDWYDYSREQVGHWNNTAEVIDYDDGEDHGAEIELRIVLAEEVGSWTQDEGVIHFDSGEDFGDTIEMHVETIDKEVEEEMYSSQSRIEVLFGISWIMCMAAPLVSIAMIIYGFAASGGKAMGVGASVALASYPIIGFFGCIAVLSGVH